MSLNKSHRLLTVALVAGLFLRLFRLGCPSLSVDEGVSYIIAQQPIGELMGFMRSIGEVHPPGYFMLLHAWLQVGSSEFWLRLSSVVAGVLTVMITWLFYREIEERDVSFPFGAALLLAVSTYHIQYSRELRMYPWLGLWAVLALWCWLRWKKSSRLWWGVGYVISCAGGFWTHYLAFLFPLIVLYFVRSTRDRKRWVLTVFCMVLLFVPNLGNLLSQMKAQDFGLRGTPEIADLFVVLGAMLGGDLFFKGDMFESIVYIGGGVIVLLGMIWVFRVKRFDERIGISLIWIFVPLLFVWSVSRFTSIKIFEIKYFVWCAPAAAAILFSLCEKRHWLLVLIILCNLFTWQFWVVNPLGGGQDWRLVANILRTKVGVDSVVLVHPSMMMAPLIYYGLPRARVIGIDLLNPEAILAKIEDRNVWLVETPNHPLVAREGLQRFITRLRGEGRILEIPKFLPSSVVRVVYYPSKKGRGRQKEE